ncbi:hypothetical protein ACWGIB_27390 [Streptomyces xiamenensis]
MIDVQAADAYPEDLMTPAQIQTEWGVPGGVLRQWATRGRIIRYPGRHRGQVTMYARQHVEPLAERYRPVPQRARAA